MVALALSLTSCWALSNPLWAACAGPCASPEIWDVRQVGDELSVTTNFGLLSQVNGDWQLICEETTPGLFLKTQLAPGARYVSTTEGLVFQPSASCEFLLVDVAQNEEDDQVSAWLVDFVLPDQTQGQNTPAFGMLLNQSADTVEILRGDAVSGFDPVVSFAIDAGYDRLFGFGSPAVLYALGYTFGPRTFRIAFSLDGGNVWTEVAPQVDAEDATFEGLQVNPMAPTQLLLSKSTLTGDADELWLFDAETQDMRPLFTLSGGASLVDSTASGGRLFVAGAEATPDGSIGSLYAGTLADLNFEVLQDRAPGFACLHAHDDLLYACNNDSTRNSEFLVASSDDDGQTWRPVLQLSELGSMPSCAVETCKTTLDWLHSTFGVLSDAGASAEASPNASSPDGGLPVADSPSDVGSDTLESGQGSVSPNSISQSSASAEAATCGLGLSVRNDRPHWAWWLLLVLGAIRVQGSEKYRTGSRPL